MCASWHVQACLRVDVAASRHRLMSNASSERKSVVGVRESVQELGVMVMMWFYTRSGSGRGSFSLKMLSTR